MSKTIYKNPIFIGLVFGCLTYAYIYWKEDVKRKKNPKSKKRPVDLITPGVVAVITWFIASCVFSNISTDCENKEIILNNDAFVKSEQVVIPEVISVQKIETPNVETQKSSAFHRIQKNSIRLPHPDVLIELAKF